MPLRDPDLFFLLGNEGEGGSVTCGLCAFVGVDDKVGSETSCRVGTTGAVIGVGGT